MDTSNTHGAAPGHPDGFSYIKTGPYLLKEIEQSWFWRSGPGAGVGWVRVRPYKARNRHRRIYSCYFRRGSSHLNLVCAVASQTPPSHCFLDDVRTPGVHRIVR